MSIKNFKDGKNVCISTSTSSGKTLIFNICGIENISNNPSTKILAIYPLKALGFEQESRWSKVLKTSGLPGKVGRIDGSVSQSDREEIIKNSSVIVITPDVIHAWLLSNVSNPSIKDFLKKVSLVVIDEAHTYSGVFGSNSAFLYRRLQHLISIAGGTCQIIAASATIKNPSEHLKKLTRVDFTVISNEEDTSPKKKTKIFLVNPPKTNDFLTSISDLMHYVVNNTQFRFIAFVDSRKQTEYIPTISLRKTSGKANSKQYDIDDLPIYPYRSGYEEDDRTKIQEKLKSDKLRGVVSTSALEMGIDIPHLNLGLLVGIPNSATSYYQRIGRIGRHRDGVIIIINNGTIHTEAIFRKPERLSKMPLSESALYLDNPYIQYIHALCLAAKPQGEDESLKNILGIKSKDDSDFIPYANFPKKFLELCKSERIGEISPEFKAMKIQAGVDPNHAYPLRNIDIQYKVEEKKGHYKTLGSLGYSQVMREAYPGAVYYYQTKPYRVVNIKTSEHLMEVKPEKKKYTTKPTMLPTLIFPNLSKENVIQYKKYGELTVVECNLQIQESIVGFTEYRGKNESKISYPLDQSLGLYFNKTRFTRNYFTTGVIINHPILDNVNVKCPLLIETIYEAFFMVIPFERQDINYGYDKHRRKRKEFGFKKDSKFLSLFDQTYGSLRLTRRFLERDILCKVFDLAIDLAKNEVSNNSYKSEIEALEKMRKELKNNKVNQVIAIKSSLQSYNNHKVVILPDSTGLDVGKGNEEFVVKDILKVSGQGYFYQGYYLPQTNIKTNVKFAVPIDRIKEIPGVSQLGLYNLETGEIKYI